MVAHPGPPTEPDVPVKGIRLVTLSLGSPNLKFVLEIRSHPCDGFDDASLEVIDPAKVPSTEGVTIRPLGPGEAGPRAEGVPPQHARPAGEPRLRDEGGRASSGCQWPGRRRSA